MSDVKEIPAVWLSAGACGGCAVSMLNTVAPSIKHLLIDEVVPGTHINLKFQVNISGGQGEPVLKAIEDVGKRREGQFLLIVDGVVSTSDWGIYCTVGERGEQRIPVREWALDPGEKALAVVALGTCSSFGGIPGARPNPTVVGCSIK